MWVSCAVDRGDDPRGVRFRHNGVGVQPVDASWEETYVIIKAHARWILDVARGTLAKRGVAEASIIDVLLDGHPGEELDAYARSHAIDLIVAERTGEKA